MVAEALGGVMASNRMRAEADDTMAFNGAPLARRPTAWGAVLGGAAMAMSVQLILTLVGVSIAAAAADPAASISDPVSALGVGALVWGCVSGLISFGIGGFVSGLLSQAPRVCSGAIHGLLVWAAAGIFGMTLASLSGAAVAGGAASGMPRVPGLATWSSSDMGGMGTYSSRMRGMGMGGTRSVTEQTASAGIERNSAMIDGSGAGNGMSDADMRAAASRAAKYTSRASLFGAIALCMGAVGGAAGGAMGRKTRDRMVRTDTTAI